MHYGRNFRGPIGEVIVGAVVAGADAMRTVQRRGPARLGQREPQPGSVSNRADNGVGAPDAARLEEVAC